jgi:hypothetical protein
MVTGNVLDPDGNPVANATVTITAGTAPYPEMAAFTSVDGWYQWILSPGTYTLEANRDGFAPSAKEITVGPGDDVQLDLTLTPN